MEIRYIYDESLAAQLPELTYADLRDMLPSVSRKDLARMKKLIPISQPLLAVTQGDVSVTVYRTGSTPMRRPMRRRLTLWLWQAVSCSTAMSPSRAWI